MNKTDLVAAIAEKTDLSKKDSEKALKAFIETEKEWDFWMNKCCEDADGTKYG